MLKTIWQEHQFENDFRDATLACNNDQTRTKKMMIKSDVNNNKMKIKYPNVTLKQQTYITKTKMEKVEMVSNEISASRVKDLGNLFPLK